MPFYLAALAGVALLQLLAVHQPVAAEPWISSRFAQNCAGCHAPGRKNLPPVKRRCTLSCQGCHVSPSGGGLRSYYGKWNEERWLRSFRSDTLRSAQSTLPTRGQHYGRDKFKPEKKAPDGGFALRESPRIPPNEAIYDRRDGLEFQTARNRSEWLYQVPHPDPYRDLDKSKVDAGADIRWQWRQGERSVTTDGDKQSEKYWMSFPMQAEIGVSYRPAHRHVRLVYEARALQSPTQEKKSHRFMGQMQRRSLYVLVDDLPYHTYMMAGYYRPLFGYFTPDHTMLHQRMQAQAISGTSSSYALEFDAVSIGGSPNVPYANFHIINRQTAPTYDRNLSGFATNLGGRFVTLGASINYSYWMSSTERPTAEGVNAEVKTEMHSLFGSLTFADFVLSLDLASFAKDNSELDFRQGGIYTFDAFYRVWREIYLNFQYALANVSEDLRPGSGNQLRLGVRSFLLPGMQFSLHYESEEVKREVDGDPSQTRALSGIVSQLHFFL